MEASNHGTRGPHGKKRFENAAICVRIVGFGAVEVQSKVARATKSRRLLVTAGGIRRARSFYCKITEYGTMADELGSLALNTDCGPGFPGMVTVTPAAWG